MSEPASCKWCGVHVGSFLIRTGELYLHERVCRARGDSEHVPVFGTMPAGAAEKLEPRTNPAASDAEERGNVPTTLAEQIALLAPHIATAVFEHGESEEAHSLAVHRLVTGHAEHGSALFTMSNADLQRNLDEEFADAIVYRAEQLRREALS